MMLLQACAGDGGPTGPDFEAPASQAGTIALTMRAGGTALDPDGYTISVDGVERGEVAVKGTTWLRNVPAGAAELRLEGVDPVCSVVGGNPRTVAVPAGELLRVTVEVSCGGDGALPPP
ncbi:MAG TPA: hypothetical protein VFT04_04400 [Gemmatimonadales bacterium]|nr:hypothetical protein [Gemmatimonadales bacterium]